MPCHSSIGKIWYPQNGVEYVEAPPPGTLWAVAYDSSRWVHTDAVISNLPDSYSLHFRTTLQTYEGDVPITMYLSGNGTSWLVGVYNKWFICRIIQNHSVHLEGCEPPIEMLWVSTKLFPLKRGWCEPIGLSQIPQRNFTKHMEWLWIVEVSVIFCAHVIGRTRLFLFAHVLLFIFLAFSSALLLLTLMFFSKLLFSSSSLPLCFSYICALIFLSVMFSRSKLFSFIFRCWCVQFKIWRSRAYCVNFWNTSLI